jgi:hypothetical protein
MEGVSLNADESAAGRNWSEVLQNPTEPSNGEETNPQVAEPLEMIQENETNQRNLRKPAVRTNYGEDYPDFSEHDDTAVGMKTRSARRGSQATVIPAKKNDKPKASISSLVTSNNEIVTVSPTVKTARSKKNKDQPPVEQPPDDSSHATKSARKPKGRPGPNMTAVSVLERVDQCEEIGWEKPTSRRRKSFGSFQETTPFRVTKEQKRTLEGPEVEPAVKKTKRVYPKKAPKATIQLEMGTVVEEIKPRAEQIEQTEAKSNSQASVALLKMTMEEPKGLALVKTDDALARGSFYMANDAMTLIHGIGNDARRQDMQETPIQLLDTTLIADEKEKQETESSSLDDTGAESSRVESELAVNRTVLPEQTHENGPEFEAPAKGRQDKKALRGKKKQARRISKSSRMTQENDLDATTPKETSATPTRESAFCSDDTATLNHATANGAQQQMVQKASDKSGKSSPTVEGKSEEEQHELSAFKTMDGQPSQLESEPAISQATSPKPTQENGSEIKASLKGRRGKQTSRGLANQVPRTISSSRLAIKKHAEELTVFNISDAQGSEKYCASNGAKIHATANDAQLQNSQETPIKLVETTSSVDGKSEEEQSVLNTSKVSQVDSEFAVNVTVLPGPTLGTEQQLDANKKGSQDSQPSWEQRSQVHPRRSASSRTKTENEPDAATFIETNNTHCSDTPDMMNHATASDNQLQVAQETPVKPVETVSIADEKSEETQHELSSLKTIDVEPSQLETGLTVSQPIFVESTHESEPKIKAPLKRRRRTLSNRGKTKRERQKRSSLTRTEEKDTTTLTAGEASGIHATGNDTQRQGTRKALVRATENAEVADKEPKNAQQHELSPFKAMDAQHGQRENEPALTLPESTLERAEGSVLDFSEKEHEYEQPCQGNTRQGRRTTKKVHETSEFLEASDSRTESCSFPSIDAKEFNHLDSQRQEAGHASCQGNQSFIPRTDEATKVRGRRTSSRVGRQENERAQKRPRRTSQSGSLKTIPGTEAEALAPADTGAAPTANEDDDISRKTKARTSLSASRRLAGMKASASIFPRSKKLSSSQTKGTPIRSSATTVATHLEPKYNKNSGSEDMSKDEDNERFHKPQRMNAKRSAVTLGRRSLAPLKSPPPLPQPPEGLKGKWTYTDETRMFLADFRDLAQVPEEDMKFLLELMARDDLVVVSEGLWNPAFEKLLRLEYLEAAFGNQIQHKFRMFSKKKEGGYAEKPEGLSMCAKDFFQYLKMKVGKEGVSRRFAFTDFKGKRHEIDVDEVSIYLIDCDLPKILPLFYDKYLDHCKIPEILPGGEMCMMNAVSFV